MAMWDNIARNKTTHLCWIVFILSISLILSLSNDLSAVKDLPGILSFALSVTSLVVGVFAIFQSLFSSEQVNSQVSMVGSSLANIRDISASAALAAKDVSQASNNIIELTNNLSQSISIIGEKLDVNTQKLAENNKLTEEMMARGERIDSPQPADVSVLADAASGLNSATSGETSKSIDIHSLTNGVLVALFASVRLAESRSSIDFSKIFTNDKHKFYVYGALVVMKGCGLVQFRRTGDIVSVESFDGFDKDELIEELDRRISKLSASGTTFVEISKQKIERALSKAE